MDGIAFFGDQSLSGWRALLTPEHCHANKPSTACLQDARRAELQPQAVNAHEDLEPFLRTFQLSAIHTSSMVTRTVSMDGSLTLLSAALTRISSKILYRPGT